MKYFNPEIHHRHAYRLKHWDYTTPAYYFVTLCIRNRQIYYFGNINNDKIILNNLGKIINKYWLKIPNHFNNVVLDEYIVMPNHVHGIIRIENNNIHPVGTCHGMSLQNTRQFSHPQKNSLSMIINQFKSACTKILKQNNQIRISFWQPKFHDHIIHNKHELYKIRQYIIDNPKNWYRDRYNYFMS